MSEADKLREEVERLARWLCGAASDRDVARKELENLRAISERLEQQAYQRGAEAMREAAAINCGSDLCASQIRALPVPEDTL